MTTLRLLRKCAKAILWILLGIVLLPCAVICLLYSPWGQDMIRTGVLPLISSRSMCIELRDFSLRFPLRLEIDGLTVCADGAEMAHVGHLEADVAVWALLSGEVKLRAVRADTLRYAMGAPDSAMYLTIAADSLGLRDASVAPVTMHIILGDGDIRRGRVDMTLNPDTVAADTAASEPSDMIIDIRRLGLDEFAYTMRMLPTIDSLGARIGHAVLRSGRIDLRGQTVAVGSMVGTRLGVAYISPDSATVAAYPAARQEQPDSSAALPWTVTVDSLAFDRSRALYTTRGTEPMPGLDFGYIAVDSLDLHVCDFYNQAAVVRVPLRMSGTERCGVRLDASGLLDIGSEGIRFKDFSVSTPLATSMAFDGLLGMGDMAADPSVPLELTLDGKVSAADARLMFPAFLPYIAAMPPHGGVDAVVRLGGTSGALDIDRLDITVNTVARLRASGRVTDMFAPDRLGGRVKLRGVLVDVNPMLASVLDPATAKSLHVPRTIFDGAVDMRAGNIDGRLTGVTDGGRVNLSGRWNSRATAYNADLQLTDFPAGAFMPAAGVGRVTASLKADGAGFDFFSPSTWLDADAEVASAQVAGHIYRDITARVHLADGSASVEAASADPAAVATLTASGNLDGSTYVWEAQLDGRHIDLHSLGMAPEQATLTAGLSAALSYTPKPQNIAAKLTLKSMTYTTAMGAIRLDNVLARLNANDSVTNISVHNRDFYAFAGSPSPVDTLVARFGRFSGVMASQTARRRINVDSLQMALPQFSIDVSAGPNNALTDLLAESRTDWRSLHLTATNDSTLGLDAEVLGFASGQTRIDTITADIAQVGTDLVLRARIDNRPGTFDRWAHVRLDGFVGLDSLALQMSQRDIAGREGYRVGLRGALTDSTATVRLYPADPTIAHKQWHINPDNFITWSYPHKHIDANLRMEGDGSSLALFTNHVDGHNEQEALTVQLKDVRLSDWISLNPFAPPMKGNLSADLSVGRQGHNINGAGTVTLADFTYNRERVGTIAADLKVSTAPGGHIRAAADMKVDGVRTVTLAGALNDSTVGSPLALDLSLIHFPLEAANPFLPAGTGRLRGTLNGQMDVSGTGTSPRLDGWLQFDSTAMKATITGTWYPFSDVRIPVENSVVRFDGFGIRGVNGNPLSVDGTVDISSPSNPRVDLRLNASDFLICDSRRAAAGADIYGKGFVNLRATARGDMNFMAVGADLAILSGTNITYVMSDAATAISRQSESGMVRFVNFADTVAVQRGDSIMSGEMAVRVDASLTMQSGASISVDLSPDGKNKVRLQPEGTIDFTMMPFGDPRVTGRLNIPRGFVRYTPPLMSEKHFDFKENSYIAFNGDMMNPTLSIHAVDVIRANVTQSGQNSRLIDFDVALDVTGSLNNMNVAFDLSTEDDVTVANELQSMSADQRANQAMNMLLYNVYTGPGTKGNASLSGNPLYSFLASQLNTWAANNIRGVDLSFGVDQYDRTVGGSTSQTTSYSYQVSKSLFNDRFKIVVGGNYSTDADADENFSTNLIRDISFEYFINKAQTMYVRIFRHTGYESILEGEITQTGVGFVYKKKLGNLKYLFGRRHRKSSITDESK